MTTFVNIFDEAIIIAKHHILVFSLLEMLANIMRMFETYGSLFVKNAIYFL